MTLHNSTFEYLMPTDEQIRAISTARIAAKHYESAIERVMPDGPDKTYALRKLREMAMWVNVGITRHPDGSPRD